MAAVRACGLVKRFETTCALDGVDLSVHEGELRGLLGPNGAGKTTLLRILFGLVAPDAGAVELFDQPRGEHLDGVAGFVEEPAFYPYLSGRANLELLAGLDEDAARARIDGALERVGLSRRAADRVSGYSTGMRQRLGIAAALLRAPRLLLLDEPTSGLDPAGSRDVAELLRELAAAGVAVLLSSHQIGEVEAVCDAFTVLRAGRVVWSGTARQLQAEAPGSAYSLRTSDDERALALAAEHDGLAVTRSARGGLLLTVSGDSLDRYVLDMADAGVAVRRLELVVSPLESMFFALTQDAELELAARAEEAVLTRR